MWIHCQILQRGSDSTISGKTGVSGIESGASDGTASADSSTDGHLKQELMPLLRMERIHRALTEIPEKTAATVTEDMRIPLTMTVIQNKKIITHTEEKPRIRGMCVGAFLFFLPFGHKNGDKKSKMGE